MNEITKMPLISAALDKRKPNHQPSMVEVEGKVQKFDIFVLIDPRSSLSYVSPNITDKCKLVKSKHKTSWLVQVSTGEKLKMTEVV